MHRVGPEVPFSPGSSCGPVDCACIMMRRQFFTLWQITRFKRKIKCKEKSVLQRMTCKQITTPSNMLYVKQTIN